MNINTPQELMRSRYEAFVTQDWKYIVDTSINQKLEDFSDASEIIWLKLDVLKVYKNIVEFKAYYKLDEKIEVIHEKSTFIEIKGEWKYQEGEQYPSKINKNESCPCGSGKKFKRCCG